MIAKTTISSAIEKPQARLQKFKKPFPART
jgi:hypothetical protein